MLSDCLLLKLALMELQGVLHVGSQSLHEGRQADISSLDWRELGLVLGQKDTGHLCWEEGETGALDDWGQGRVFSEHQGLLVGVEGGWGHHSHGSFHEIVRALGMA